MKTALTYLQPEISVILVAQNQSKNLFKIINSVMNQTQKSWELIIVDNGSEDNAFYFVNPFLEKNDNIRYLKHKNRSVISAINIGIQASLGEYVTFIGAEDKFLPQHLKSRIEILENNDNTKMLHGGFEVIGETRVKDPMNPGQKISIYDTVLLNSIVAPRKLFFELGGFKEIAASEVDFCERAAKLGEVTKVVDPKTYIHTHIL